MVSYVESARQMGAANTKGDARAPAAALELCPPATRIALFGGMVHNVEGMSGRGYSSKVIKALGDARASSTNKVYDSKWRLFATFSSSRGIVPEVATPPKVAEFLIYLFDVSKCSSRTIAAYRSALGNVLRFTSRYDPGEDKVLSQLLKGFERKRAPVARRIPS